MTRLPWSIIVRPDRIDGEEVIYVGQPDQRQEKQDFTLTWAESDAARVFDRDDADLIVRAVNLHDELVGALRNFVHLLGAVPARIRSGEESATLEAARAVLAKAVAKP